MRDRHCLFCLENLQEITVLNYNVKDFFLQMKLKEYIYFKHQIEELNNKLVKINQHH